MRKSIDGLSALVEQEMALSPSMEALFVFCNRGRDKMKLLCWERNGFIVWYKRLEKQRFRWSHSHETMSLTGPGTTPCPPTKASPNSVAGRMPVGNSSTRKRPPQAKQKEPVKPTWPSVSLPNSTPSKKPSKQQTPKSDTESESSKPYPNCKRSAIG